MLENLLKQMAFIQEADKMKGILRANMMLDLSRREDDAQHSWHIALMTLVMAEYADPAVDIDHALRMLLIHDMVEIDAGDTYAYDEAAQTDKSDREQKAADRIFGLLPKRSKWLSAHCGRSLRIVRHRHRNMPTPSTGFSRFGATFG